MKKDDFKTTELIKTRSDVPEDVVGLPQESRYDDGPEDAVGPHMGEEGAASDAGEGSEPDSFSDGAGRSGSRRQTREENSAIRSARIRAKREAEAAERLRADETVALSGIINPLTGEPFTSLDQLAEYGELMRRSEISDSASLPEKSAEKPEEDEDRRFIRQLRLREEEKQRREAAGKRQRDFIEKDVMQFIEAYPEFSVPEKLAELENSESFRYFCGSRFGKEPLVELYGAYRRLLDRVGAEAEARSASRIERSTGSGGSGGIALTASQKKALDRWNDENPDMMMTAREFLSR